jgi:hypothetical protein
MLSDHQKGCFRLPAISAKGWCRDRPQDIPPTRDQSTIAMISFQDASRRIVGRWSVRWLACRKRLPHKAIDLIRHSVDRPDQMTDAIILGGLFCSPLAAVQDIENGWPCCSDNAMSQEDRPVYAPQLIEIDLQHQSRNRTSSCCASLTSADRSGQKGDR